LILSKKNGSPGESGLPLEIHLKILKDGGYFKSPAKFG